MAEEASRLAFRDAQLILLLDTWGLPVARLSSQSSAIEQAQQSKRDLIHEPSS